MTRFLIRRVLLGILILFLVSVVVFAATQALPGNAARAILGRQATPDRLAALTKQLHLNESAFAQYWHWLSGILTGNLGTSSSTQEPVSKLISGPLANSAFLVLVSALIALPVSIGLGVWMAVKRDKPTDHVFSTGTLVIAALPEFVIGIGLTLLLATKYVWPLLPSVSIIPPGTHAWDNPKVVILPTLTLILAVTPYISRIMRASMVEVLHSDYVTMARLKGLSNHTVIWRHAVPNAIVPAIQVAGLQLAYLAGGIVIVEYVFNYNGIGTQLVNAVTNRDVPTVVTPRLRTAGR